MITEDGQPLRSIGLSAPTDAATSATPAIITNRPGLSRSNPLIDAVIATHPLETWTFEVLEELPPGCPKETLRRAEQRHIERLRSFQPERGFNIYPAWWFGTMPGVLAGRARRAEETRKMLKRKIAMHRQRDAIFEMKAAERDAKVQKASVDQHPDEKPAVKAPKPDAPAVRSPAGITAKTHEDAQ